jgi:hypothetical protein
MAKWEYFVLRRSDNNYGEAVYSRGDSGEPVCPANTAEDVVLNIFGQHGYELTSVIVTRVGHTKYFFKRAKS